MASDRVAPFVVERKTEDNAASFILIHGLGDSGRGWMPVARMLARVHPHIKWILPNAKEAPVTINMGYPSPSWYDILSLSGDAEQDADGIKASAAYIQSLVAAEIEAGVPADRIVVGGFSQGAVMSLWSGLTFDQTLAGVVVLSGYVPLNDALATEAHEANRKTPIFQAHGTADAVLAFDRGVLSRDFLKDNDFDVEWHAYEGMQHSSSQEEIQDLSDFIAKVLPSSAS